MNQANWPMPEKGKIIVRSFQKGNQEKKKALEKSMNCLPSVK